MKCVYCREGGQRVQKEVSKYLFMWYNDSMPLYKTRKLIVASLIGVIILSLLLLLGAPQKIMGRVLEGKDYLRLQVESDFDRDGDIDFLDFTVFSAFYEEV